MHSWPNDGGSTVVALTTLLALAVAVPLLVTGAAADPVDNQVAQENATAPRVSISNLSVTPDQPAPGELVKFTTTVTNAQSSPQSVEITAVYVRERGGSSDIARARDIGTLTAGNRIPVPLTGSFDDTGVKDLQVTVVVLTEDDRYIRLKYPVTLVVRDDGLRVDVDAAPSTVDGERTLAVTVLNGRSDTFRNLELVAGGTNVEFESSRRLEAVFEGGETETYTYTATGLDEGVSTVDVDLSYTTPLGQRRTIERQVPLDRTAAAGPSEHPQIALSVQDGLPGAQRSVNVTVANGLNSDVRQLSVTASSPEADFAVAERVHSSLVANETTVFSFPASVAERGRYPVNVTLSYTRDGVRRRVTDQFSASFDAPPNPAEITLTGTEATLRGGTLEISATASNVGSGVAESVVVSVGDSQAVESTDYFVGSVDPSDFSSFTLNTGVSGNISTVPVRVEYVVDGARQSVTTDVSVERNVIRRPETSGGGGGLPVIPIAVVLVVVAAVVIYRRRG